MAFRQLFLASSLSQIFFSISLATVLPVSHSSSQNIKRADPTWHSSCDAYPEIKDAWAGALHMAQHAIDVLSNNDPFSDQNAVNQDPFQFYWEPARLNLFGQNSLTSHDRMLQFYQNIAAGPAVTVACSDPPNPSAPDAMSRCDLYDQDTWMYRLNLDPNGEGYADDKSMGFADGNNLIVCPVAFPGGRAGIKTLANRSPEAGDALATYRYTYEFQLVHELAHVVGAQFDHKYGMPDCTQMARDAAHGGSQEPADNADSWALFALAVSDISNPPMSNYDWTGGSTGENARPYEQA